MDLSLLNQARRVRDLDRSPTMRAQGKANGLQKGRRPRENAVTHERGTVDVGRC